MRNRTQRGQYITAYLSLVRRGLPFVFAGFLVIGNPVSLNAAESSIAISAIDYDYVCSIKDASPGLRTIYVLHTFSLGVTASRFRVSTGLGNTMTYVSETHPFSQTLGNTQTGITICYGGCMLDNQLLATIQYMSFGTSSLCSKFLVNPHPQAQTVEATDCNFTPVAAFVQDLAVSTASGSCGCPLPHVFPGTPQQFDCAPVAVRATTWGAIKSLYQN